MDKLSTALDITGGFEGCGYNNVIGNFDGQGLSAGILQWNYGQGSLQALLLKYEKDYGPLPDKTFPEPISPSARLSGPEAIAFSEKMQDHEGLKREWRFAWKAFLSTPEMVQIQKDFAQIIGQKADAIVTLFGLNSLRAYCWAFDIIVQNGSLLGVKPELGNPNFDLATPENKMLWANLNPTNEQQLLLVASYNRAMKAKGIYSADIFNRKATIVMGKGVVHGRLFDLSLHGLS